MEYRKFLIIAFSLILTISVYPQNSKTDQSEADNGDNQAEGLVIEPDVNYWGMNADVSIYGFELFEGLSSRIILSGGAGIRNIGYYRDENDVFIEEDDGSYDVYSDFTHFRIHTNWGAGISQGIINNEGSRNDLVYAVFKYRGIREWNLENDSRSQILFNSVREDSDGILLNSLIAALVYESVSEDKRSGNIRGIYSEISYERAPEWFFNDITGESDFHKYFGSFTFYIPLNEFKNKNSDIVSGIYLADCFSADFVAGDKIPLIARQTMGSLSPKNGLGGTVRGFETRRFDGELTVSNNLETRLTLPVIKSKYFSGSRLYVRPGIFTFFDSGYYDLLEGTDAGYLLSCGGGVFGDINGILQASAFLSFPLEGERLDEKAMDFSLSLNFHF